MAAKQKPRKIVVIIFRERILSISGDSLYAMNYYQEESSE